MFQNFLQAGKIVGTHGVRGEIRVQPWCDSPSFLTQFKKIYTDKDGLAFLNIKQSRAHKNICLLKVDGIDTIDQAEALRGKVLYIDRNDCKLPKGSYFIEDIIGCTVLDSETNEEYGKISDVSQTGANDIWHISRNNKEYLIPNVPTFVSRVDINEGVVYITPLEGTFDDEN